MVSAAMAAFFKWLVAMYNAGRNIVPLMTEYKALEKQQQGASAVDDMAAVTAKVKSTVNNDNNSITLFMHRQIQD